MSEYKAEDKKLFKQFALMIYSDIQKYIAVHQSEYEEYSKNPNANIFTKDKKKNKRTG